MLPILDAAKKALEKITKNDITQLKSFPKPPESAAIVMEGLCYAFNEDQNAKWVAVNPGDFEKK